MRGGLCDLVLGPAGIWLALKLAPERVLAQARDKARRDAALPANRKAA